MPKCLECGFESQRLQWTHFKYKCTGRFSNGQEYMAAYVGAKTVDEDLAKRTAVTKENLITKYGEVEGQRLWESYRHKQAYSNSFEYKKEKHNWTEQDFKSYNASRAITPETMIKKYGLQEGIKKYENYCDKQKLTKSKDYVVANYGIEKWEAINRKKAEPHDVKKVAEKFNISLDEAVEKIAARGRARYVSNLELEFVAELEKLTGPLAHTNNNAPFGKWDHQRNQYVVYDIKHGNCVVEFNGDYWHANPVIYSPDDLIRAKRAEDIWAHDKIKLDIARQAGLNVKVVWERDYLTKKESVLKEVAEWIQNTHK
jgi:hypothetical protein